MIWSTTTHMGVALATSSSGTTYVVARYSPAGNVIGQSPAQSSNSGGVQMPASERHEWPSQPRHPRLSGNRGGIQPPLQRRGHGNLYPQSPFQPLPPGSSGYENQPGISGPPPPQSGLVGPDDYARLLADPDVTISPYNPFGPFPLPVHPASAIKPAPTSCCTIL